MLIALWFFQACEKCLLSSFCCAGVRLEKCWGYLGSVMRCEAHRLTASSPEFGVVAVLWRFCRLISVANWSGFGEVCGRF